MQVVMSLKHYSRYLNPYMEKILSNEIEHCKEQEQLIKNVVIPVLERDDVIFDEKRVEDGLSLQKYFPYGLIEWEIFLFACIIGIRLADGSDVFFKDIWILVGRGSGKNGFADFLIFYLTSPYNGIKGYNVDILANSEEQAKTSFNDIYEIVTDPPPQFAKAMKSNYTATKEDICCKVTKSHIRYNTSSAKTKDSKRTGCVLIDEKHAYLSTDGENINVLTSGLGKVPEDRTITISSDGKNRGGLLDQDKDKMKDILKEYNPENRTLPFWCHIENEEEWKDPDKWIKSIPSLNDSAFAAIKRRIAKEVKDMPYTQDYYPEFMAKRMGYPVGNKDVEIATWDDILATNQEIPNLDGMACIGACDYALTNDFAGVVLIFRINEKIYVKQHTFVCKYSRDLPGIKAPIEEWGAKGDLTIVDEVEIPADMLAEWFDRQIDEHGYRVKGMVIDYFRRGYLIPALKRIGFSKERKNLFFARPNDIGQVVSPINSLFINHNLVIGDVPVFRWMVNNVKKYDSGNNILYGKIEPHYRKTDTFQAFAAGMTQIGLLDTPNLVDISGIEPIII